MASDALPRRSIALFRELFGTIALLRRWQRGSEDQEMRVPSSLQYPLERERDLQRRWSRLLQRTLASQERAFVASRGEPHAEPGVQFGRRERMLGSGQRPLKRAHLA